MSRLVPIVMAGLVACLPFMSASPENISGEQLRGLDEQVQEIKSDVLEIAAELERLEDRLLYPSKTQFAVFVELADDSEFRLDAVKIEIDGQLVAHYIYSFKELEALQNGGVQRLYTGNIATGEHELHVTYDGKLKGGKEVTRSDRFSFIKDVEPKLLGLTVASADAGPSGIALL